MTERDYILATDVKTMLKPIDDTAGCYWCSGTDRECPKCQAPIVTVVGSDFVQVAKEIQDAAFGESGVGGRRYHFSWGRNSGKTKAVKAMEELLKSGAISIPE